MAPTGSYLPAEITVELFAFYLLELLKKIFEVNLLFLFKNKSHRACLV